MQSLSQCPKMRCKLVALILMIAIKSSSADLCLTGGAKSCSEIQQLEANLTTGQTRNCIISPIHPRDAVEARCDFESFGGGWTIIQQRSSGPKRQFYRDWVDYDLGFYGDEGAAGNYWIGLRTIHALTAGKDQELRIELADWEGKVAVATYDEFHVSDASDKYRLSVSGYSGDAGDSLSNATMNTTNVANGMQFSTRDKDNDNDDWECAIVYNGGWWYNKCHNSNLNGLYRGKEEPVPYANGVVWKSWKGYYYSAKEVHMKIRPRSFSSSLSR